MNLVNKYFDISFYYPLIYTLSKINLSMMFIVMPLIFIFGQWLYCGIYIFFLSVVFLFGKLKNADKIKIYPKLFLVVILISGIHAAYISVDRIEGIVYFIATIFIPLILFIVITNSELSISNINSFINVNIIAGIVLGLFSIYVVNILGSPGVRISSIWEDFNIIAAYFMIIIFLIISKIIHAEDKRLLFFYLLALIPVLLGLFFTQTRGVWLSVIISLLFYILKRPKALVPAIIIFCFILMFFYSIVLDRFLSVKNFNTDISSLGRIQAWVASILIIKDHWLLGAGFDGFEELKLTVFDYYIVEVPHSHNTYLRLILELGVIGFIPYISLMIFSFVYTFKLIKVYKKNKNIIKIIDALQLSFVGLFVAFIFEPYFSLYGNSTIIIWCLISITFYLYKRI